MSERNECVSCSRNDMEIPLLEMRYQGNKAWICSQCLPVLIHKPHVLAGRLSGAGESWAAPHDDH